MNSHQPWPDLPYSALQAEVASGGAGDSRWNMARSRSASKTWHAGAICNDGINITLKVMASANGHDRDEEYEKIAAMGALRSIGHARELWQRV